MKYLIYIINCLLVIAIPLTFIAVPSTKTSSEKVKVSNTDKYLKSDVLAIVIEEELEVEEESNEIEEKTTTNNTTQNKVVTEVEKVETPQPVTDVLETQVGKMSGYGPDCVGCSGYLASGKNVTNGNIYYSDSKYGQVRILAGDRIYKFGTIVRVKNSRAGNFIGIVLDRGGSIGLSKKFMFDLLYASEAEAAKDEVSYNVTFEILRYGY